jgi:hypothetical protein
MVRHDFECWKKFSIGLAKVHAVSMDAVQAKAVNQAMTRFFFDIQDVKLPMVNDWYSGPHRIFRRLEMFLASNRVCCAGKVDGMIHLTDVGYIVEAAVKTGFAAVVFPLNDEDMPQVGYRIADIKVIFGKPIPAYVQRFFVGVDFTAADDDSVLDVKAFNQYVLSMAVEQQVA